MGVNLGGSNLILPQQLGKEEENVWAYCKPLNREEIYPFLKH